MPRRVQIQEDPSDDDDIPSSPPPARPVRSSRADPNLSPFSSSDKENAASAAKGSASNSREHRSSNGGLSGMSSTQRSQQLLEDECDKDAYDPNQDPEERRRIKKEYRTLHRTLLGISLFFSSFPFVLFFSLVSLLVAMMPPSILFFLSFLVIR